MFFKTNYKKLTDEQLVQKLVKGHTPAFDELYCRYHEKLYYYFYRMLGQQTALAADYTQDLFVKLIEKANLFDPQKRFSTWIYTIASNLCKNAYRAQKSKGVVLSVENWEQYIEQLAIDLDEATDYEHFQQDLQIALEGLKPKHKTCFVLRYQQGCTIQEISAIEQIPSGTVKSRLHYALQQLAQKLMIHNPNKR